MPDLTARSASSSTAPTASSTSRTAAPSRPRTWTPATSPLPTFLPTRTEVFMTISSQGVRAVYLGSGSTGPFTLQDASAQAILFEDNSEIVVTRYNTSGVGTE